MKRPFFVFIFFAISVVCYSQTDTQLVKNQKGYLFISSYNYKYDWEGGHMRPIGFHDYFFPSDSGVINFLSDSSNILSFKDGLRVDNIRERYYLKKMATEIKCSDKGECYYYKNFYIIPIVISYKKYEDNWPLPCHKESFELKVTNGRHTKFGVQHKAIIVLKHSLWQLKTGNK